MSDEKNNNAPNNMFIQLDPSEQMAEQGMMTDPDSL